MVTRSSGRLAEIEALGARVIDFDFRRSSSNPAREAASAWALARILEAEDADVVHLVAMKPVVLGGFALKLVPARHVVVHMTGLGLLGFGEGHLLRLYRAGALRLMASMLRKPASYLLVENPDDLALLRASGVDPGARFAILGGAGVDPEAFPALPQPRNAVPVAAFVGRMIRPKGIDVLMQACDRLKRRGVALQLELYGGVDTENPDAVTGETLTAWCATLACALARPRRRYPRRVAARRHLRSAGAEPGGHAARPARGCGERAPARRYQRARLPPLRARRRRRLRGAAGGRRGAGQGPGASGARSGPAPTHGRGGPLAAAAWLYRGPCQAIAAGDVRVDDRQLPACHDARRPARLLQVRQQARHDTHGGDERQHWLCNRRQAPAPQAHALAALTRHTTPAGVAPPSTARW